MFKNSFDKNKNQIKLRICPKTSYEFMPKQAKNLSQNKLQIKPKTSYEFVPKQATN